MKKIKDFIISLKFPIFMQMQSVSALLFGIGLLIHEYTNIKTTDLILLMDFENGYIELLGLIFMISGIVFFLTYFIEFIVKYIYYLKNKKNYQICPKCGTNLYSTGFIRNHIGLNYVEIICKKCGEKIYRKGML